MVVRSSSRPLLGWSETGGDMLETQLAQLFMQTGKDHHLAFIETDGEDPDWPQWYAEYLEHRLPELLESFELSRPLIAQALIEVDQFHRESSNGEWPQAYAQFFINRFGSPADD